jgi:hypothetical protein
MTISFQITYLAELKKHMWLSKTTISVRSRSI